MNRTTATQISLCILALVFGMSSTADGFRFGVAATNDIVSAQSDLALAFPIDGGPSWGALFAKDKDSTNVPGLSAKFGYFYTALWKTWAETSLECSLSLKDAASSRYSFVRSGAASERWSLGRYSSLMFTHKVGNDHLQLDLNGRTFSPYLGLSIGRFRNDFELDGALGRPSVSDVVSGDIGKFGFGTFIGDGNSKGYWDIGLFWELYRISHTSKYPNRPDIDFLLYDVEVTQWKMKVGYTFSL